MAFLDKYYPEVSYSRNILDHRLNQLENNFINRSHVAHQVHHHQLEENIVHLYDLVKKTAQNQSQMQSEINLLRNKSVANMFVKQEDYRQSIRNLQKAYRKTEQRAYSLKQRINQYYPNYMKKDYYSRYDRQTRDITPFNAQIYTQSEKIQNEWRRLRQQRIENQIRRQQNNQINLLHREREDINRLILKNNQLLQFEKEGNSYLKTGNDLFENSISTLQQQFLQNSKVRQEKSTANFKTMQQSQLYTPPKYSKNIVNESIQVSPKSKEIFGKKNYNTGQQKLHNFADRSYPKNSSSVGKLYSQSVRRGHSQKQTEEYKQCITESKFLRQQQNSPIKKMNEVQKSVHKKGDELQNNSENSFNMTRAYNNLQTDRVLMEQNNSNSLTNSFISKFSPKNNAIHNLHTSDVSVSVSPSHSRFKPLTKYNYQPESETQMQVQQQDQNQNQLKKQNKISNNQELQQHTHVKYPQYQLERTKQSFNKTKKRQVSPNSSAQNKRNKIKNSEMAYECALQRIRKRMQNMYAVYEDATFRNVKHQQDHLLNTFGLQNRLRTQIIQKIQKNTLVQKKYGLPI